MSIHLGLLQKAFRETVPLLAAVLIGVLFATSLLIRVLPHMQTGIEQFLAATPMMGVVMSSFLGVQVAGAISGATLMGLLWSHPVLLTMVWGLAVALATRYPAGEVEQGTIDVLLSWPVSRRTVFFNHTAVCVLAGVAVCLIALVGFQTGKAALDQAPRFQVLAVVALNLFATYLAVAGLAILVSSCSARRGTAIAVLAGLLLASYLLNFLALFWDWAEALSWLSLSSYYQPGQALLSGRIPGGHLETLLLFALGSWIAAGVIHAHSDLPTA